LTAPALPAAPGVLKKFVTDAGATNRMPWRDMVGQIVA
jgi:hypothetical protein